jgi:hypothetical protein
MTSVYPTYASKQSDYITIEQLVLVVVIIVQVNAKVDECNKAQGPFIYYIITEGVEGVRALMMFDDEGEGSSRLL